MNLKINEGNTMISTSRKRWIFICIAVLFILGLITAIISLPLLYIVQRDVNFSLMPLDIENTVIDITPKGFILPLKPKILADNRNYFDINLTNIQAKGYHLDYSNGTVPLATGELTSIALIRRAEIIFSLPFTIEFITALDPNLHYFSMILNNCSAPPSQIYLYVIIDVDYEMWAKSGKIRETRDIYVPCPITPKEASNYKSLLPLANSFGL